MALFKMKPGYGPFKKALVGNQHRLPEHLKQAIKNAAPKLTDKPTDKNRKELGRGGKDVVISEKESTVRRRDNSRTGARDFEQVKQTVEKGSQATPGTTMSDRQGGGRIATKTYQRGKGQKGKFTMLGSDTAGTRTSGGRTQYRTLPDGSKVVIEASLQERGEAPKRRGIQNPKIRATGSTEDLKKKAAAKKIGVKGLAKKSAAKKYGCKKKK